MSANKALALRELVEVLAVCLVAYGCGSSCPDGTVRRGEVCDRSGGLDQDAGQRTAQNVIKDAGVTNHGGAGGNTSKGGRSGESARAGDTATGGRSASGGAGASGSSPEGGATDGGAGGSSPESCKQRDDCPSGMNCIQKQCVDATVSCTAQANRRAELPDGVYWINPTGTPLLAYCDMNLETELCTEIEAQHDGRTRDGANLPFTLRSRLQLADNSCRLWALQDATEHLPLAALQPQGQPLTTCQALGFIADAKIGSCPYGDNTGWSNCGFGSAPYYSWGNTCTGCELNDGSYTQFKKQGPMHQGSVITSLEGGTFTTCKVE